MSFAYINNTSAINTNESNDKIMHNNILVPQMPGSRSDIKNNIFSNFDTYDVLTPQSYKSVNNSNKNEELLIDLSDDDSQNKTENNAQYGSGVRDFCGTVNQDYDLIDLYENILATPQAILKKNIIKSNSTTKTNFRNTLNNTENERIENTVKDTSYSCLDDLLNINTEIKANNCNYIRTDQSARADTIVKNSNEPTIFTDFKTNLTSHSTLTSAANKPGQKLIITGDFDKIKSNHGQEQNSSPNFKFHNYSNEVDVSHEDIDDIIDEVLSMKSREAHYIQEHNHKLQAATSSQNHTNQKIDAAYTNRGSNSVSSSGSTKSYIDNDYRDLEFLPKLKFCDVAETETSSVDIDDVINDIFNLKSLGISKINIEYPNLKATAGSDDLPRPSNSDDSKSSISNAEFYAKNVFENKNLKNEQILDTGNVNYNQVQMLHTKPEDDGKNRKKRHESEKDGFLCSPLPEWIEIAKEVNVTPVVLMEDSRKVRLEALEKRRLFSEFVKGK